MKVISSVPEHEPLHHLLISSCCRSSELEAGTRTAPTPVFPCQAMPLGSCLPASPFSKMSIFDVKQFRTESQGVVQIKSSNSVAADVSSSMIRHAHSKKVYSDNLSYASCIALETFGLPVSFSWMLTVKNNLCFSKKKKVTDDSEMHN